MTNIMQFKQNGGAHLSGKKSPLSPSLLMADGIFFLAAFAIYLMTIHTERGLKCCKTLSCKKFPFSFVCISGSALLLSKIKSTVSDSDGRKYCKKILITVHNTPYLLVWIYFHILRLSAFYATHKKALIKA